MCALGTIQGSCLFLLLCVWGGAFSLPSVSCCLITTLRSTDMPQQVLVETTYYKKYAFRNPPRGHHHIARTTFQTHVQDLWLVVALLLSPLEGACHHFRAQMRILCVAILPGNTSTNQLVKDVKNRFSNLFNDSLSYSNLWNLFLIIADPNLNSACLHSCSWEQFDNKCVNFCQWTSLCNLLNYYLAALQLLCNHS